MVQCKLRDVVMTIYWPNKGTIPQQETGTTIPYNSEDSMRPLLLAMPFNETSDDSDRQFSKILLQMQ